MTKPNAASVDEPRPFAHPNYHNGFTCPVCGTSADQPVVLVGIPGTEDGNIMQAAQVHQECYRLVKRMSEAPTNDQ